MTVIRIAIVMVGLIAMTQTVPASAQFWKNLLNGSNNNGVDWGSGNPGYNVNSGFNPGMNPGFNPGYNPGWGNNNNNNSQITASLRNVERTSDQLTRNVQQFLQSSGRFFPAPKGNDAALLMTLDAMKSQARSARRAAEGNDTQKLMSQLSQLQVIAGNAANVARSANFDAYTIGQLQVLQNNIQQASMLASMVPIGSQGGSGYPTGYGYPSNYNPNYPYPNNGGYYPHPLNPMLQQGYLQATGSGRGQFAMMGQVFMNIRNATMQASDPVGKKAVFTISAGRDVINLTGTLVSQTPTSATIQISGSDRGAASGVINGILAGNGSLMSANGNGTLNGQAFIISFKSN